jgi:hypothetical protein
MTFFLTVLWNWYDKVKDWYVDHIEESIIINLIIITLQIPHMIWNADLYLEIGTISKVNPVSDFLLYGIDLLEIPLIIKTISDFIILEKKKRGRKNIKL